MGEQAENFVIRKTAVGILFAASLTVPAADAAVRIAPRIDCELGGAALCAVEVARSDLEHTEGGTARYPHPLMRAIDMVTTTSGMHGSPVPGGWPRPS